MSDPSPLTPNDPRRPFAEAPRPTPGGCGKPVLIGCGLASILLGVAAIVFVMKAKSLLVYTMEQLKTQVVAAMPAEVTDAERERLESAFAAAAQRIRSGEIDAAALQVLQGKLMTVAEKAPHRTVTRADVIELTSALERFGAGPGDEPAVPPEAAPGDGTGAADQLPGAPESRSRGAIASVRASGRMDGA